MIDKLEINLRLAGSWSEFKEVGGSILNLSILEASLSNFCGEFREKVVVNLVTFKWSD
jgi:hypothetical protein